MMATTSPVHRHHPPSHLNASSTTSPRALLAPFPFVAPASMTPLDSLIAILAVEEANWTASSTSDPGQMPSSATTSGVGNNNVDASRSRSNVSSNKADYPDPIPSPPTTVSPLALRLDSSSRSLPPSSDPLELPSSMSEPDHHVLIPFALTTPTGALGSSSSPQSALPPHFRVDTLAPLDSRDPFNHIGFTLEFTLQPRTASDLHSPVQPAPRRIALTHNQPVIPAAAARHVHSRSSAAPKQPAPNPPDTSVGVGGKQRGSRARKPSFVSTDPLSLPPPRPISRKSKRTRGGIAARGKSSAAAAIVAGPSGTRASLRASAALGKILRARGEDEMRDVQHVVDPATAASITRGRAGAAGRPSARHQHASRAAARSTVAAPAPAAIV
ncbi:hypothetical protein BCR44DRAFT_1423626 [Catenaria anguillulae PL171]|uniref:Uncharacterized protein n=1 Tax=Catenaria anguillulae PL171 TaxID=765915 RepID=A0A1Y2I5A3_9FUNG|nr:hypothetical protein BCR44DRAFT_1423626 [Catenaria anguillulae PL171]